MAKGRTRRVLTIAAVTVAGLALAAAVGFNVATRALKSKVEQALGPESEVGEISIGWSAVEVRRVRIGGPAGWPAPDALRARHIVIVPDLRSLLSSRVVIHRIAVEGAYLSVLRSRDGRLRLLPSLMETPGASAGAAAPAVAIGKVELSDGEIEFYDATVRKPAHKVRLEQLKAGVGPLEIPGLSGRTRIDLDGKVKGVNHNGDLAVHGWAEVAAKNSETATRLRGVDLIALQPYLVKATDAGVRRGSLDLDLKSTVRKNMLHAPGSLTLTNLELENRGGSFMGMPRQAAVSALKDHNSRISIKFELDGNLADPKFSLNENLATRVGSSVAGLLGVSIEGLAKGVGTATRGVGEAVKRLFGK